MSLAEACESSSGDVSGRGAGPVPHAVSFRRDLSVRCWFDQNNCAGTRAPLLCPLPSVSGLPSTSWGSSRRSSLYSCRLLTSSLLLGSPHEVWCVVGGVWQRLSEWHLLLGPPARRTAPAESSAQLDVLVVRSGHSRSVGRENLRPTKQYPALSRAREVSSRFRRLREEYERRSGCSLHPRQLSGGLRLREAWS